MRNLHLGKAGVGDGFAHGDVVVGGAVAHEPPDLAVDMRVEIDLQRAVHVAAEANPGIGLAKLDPRTAGIERIDQLGPVAADAGDDPSSGNAYTAQRPEAHQPESQS